MYLNMKVVGANQRWAGAPGPIPNKATGRDPHKRVPTYEDQHMSPDEFNRTKAGIYRIQEGKAKLKKLIPLMTASKKILGRSKTTSNTALRAELGLYPLQTETNRFLWSCSVRNTESKIMPAIVIRAGWKKMTKRQADLRSDNVVQNVWTTRGNQ